MKQQIEAIKLELGKNGFSEKLIILMKELREYFKTNLNEPGYVRMIRLAYEDIEANGSYTYLYLEDDGAKENLSYLMDLLADHTNKYNREELQEVRNLMEGIVPEEDETAEAEQE